MELVTTSSDNFITILDAFVEQRKNEALAMVQDNKNFIRESVVKVDKQKQYLSVAKRNNTELQEGSLVMVFSHYCKSPKINQTRYADVNRDKVSLSQIENLLSQLKLQEVQTSQQITELQKENIRNKERLEEKSAR
jgi:hypothetical protein